MKILISLAIILSMIMPTATTTSTDVASLEARIAELEAENAMYIDKIAKLEARQYNAEIVLFASDKIDRCDINGDRLINAVDAGIILQAYALISTGENIWSISQVVNWDLRGDI